MYTARKRCVRFFNMIYKIIRSNSPWVGGLILISFIVISCSPASTPPAEVVQGSSKEDVIAFYGKPDRAQDLVIPEEPFFGPQEGLANLVPPGTVIEEWVYEIGDEELYIWFTGDNDVAREDWRVLDLGRYPKGAVY
jgi:hypothetical protein